MARLVTCKSNEDSLSTYSTFANDLDQSESNENLTFNLTNPRKSLNLQKRQKDNCCKEFFRKCCLCCKYGSVETVSEDIDAEFAIIKYEQSLKATSGLLKEPELDSTCLTSPSQKSTLRLADQPKTYSPSPEFMTDVLNSKDKFLDKLEHDKSAARIRRSHNVPDIAISCAPDDSSISGSSSPLASQRYMDKSLSTNALSSPTSSGFMWSSKEESKDKLFDLNEKRPMSSLGVRSDSMASVYSGAGDCHYGSVMVKGDVEFGLQYNYKPGSLQINIKQCRDLAAIDMKRNRSDPYVKVYLLPDKSKSGKRKTKVKKHTLNPCFDETLSFNLTLEELKSRTLWLTVWHSDMFGRNDFLGEVMMSLEDKIFDDPTPKWYQLQERTEPFEDITTYKGDIIIGLKFIPPDMTSTRKGKRSRGALHVLIKEAKNLTAVKANGTSDPFCKSYLLPDKGRSSKQKTPVLRRCLNPKWNYTFIYDDVTLQDLSERALELTVWDHDRLGSNEFLGMVRFSLGTGKYRNKSEEWMEATDKEISLWQNMLSRPNFWVEGCLSLRPSLGNKTG